MTATVPRPTTAPATADVVTPPSPPWSSPRWVWALAVGLAALHTWAIWAALGGWAGISNPWPLAKHDHPLYFHSAVVTRHFLAQSGTTAGYDPSFMAGYPKSVVFPASSTVPELVVWLFGGTSPGVAYKLYVLVAASAVPWLVILAARVWKLGTSATCAAVVLFLGYLWADYPINYAEHGMLPYLLAVPLGLVALAVLSAYLERGGLGSWLASALAMSLAFLVHLTSAMVLAPASLVAYGVASWEVRPFPLSRHVGFWTLGVVVPAVNAFWWLPGLWLAGTKGVSDFAFAHPEPLWIRLVEVIFTPTQAVLWALGAFGLAAWASRARVASAGLAGLAAAGFFWGYLAGWFRELDFLQPGRHTFVLYAALAMAAGAGWAELRARSRAWGRGLATLAALGLILVGVTMLGPGLIRSVQVRVTGPEPFLSGLPSPRMQWVVSRVRRHVAPGERLLYEEGGFALPGVPDPFRGGRYSGLLPHFAGVEVLGGPYLHAALTTNFTQFGEGRLFGRNDWDRDHFERYARLYRPAAILCWSPRARAFCEAHPDLITIVETLDLGAEGQLLIGRVQGFEGDTITGQARVAAEPGRLRVEPVAPELDEPIVLRYHSVPYLRSRPPLPIEPVRQDDDPVPFIGLRGLREPVTLELVLPPRP